MAETPLFLSAGHADQRVSVIGSLSGAMFLGADRVVFVDRLSQQLLFLNTASGAVASAGRKGNGPQEFKSVQLLARSADGSVVVWDPGRRRMNLVSLMDGKGVVGELPGYDKSELRSGRMTEPVARYEDGTIVYEGSELPTVHISSLGPTREPGPYRTRFEYWLAVPGEPKQLVFEGLGLERFKPVSTRSGSSWPEDVIFGHSILHTQVGQFVAVSQTDLGSVLVFDRSGRVVAEVPLELGNAVTQEDIDAVRERRLAINEDQQRQIREQMQGRDFPVDIASLWAKRRDNIRATPANETAPPIDRMQGDLDGRLWLRLFRPRETGQRWQVWELGGPRLVFTLVLPEGEAFLDAAGDRVLLRARDEFDVDYLVIKEIVR